MVAYTTLALFLIALLGSVNVGIKRDKWLSLLVFMMFAGVFILFCGDFLAGRESSFSFLWNSSPGGDINIDIVSNIYNYHLILPFFMITLTALLQNLLFRYEERRSFYGAVLIFNLVTLITMITGNNFVQLLCAIFVADILILFLVKDMEAYKRYILLNISADMIIFTIMAIINCKVDSLDIHEILRYKQTGHHLDFIAIAGLTAVFMKIGLFFFHIGLIGLQNIRLHRLQNILFLSSPIYGLIILMKFHVLWNSSVYFTPYLHSACLLSFAGGFAGSIMSSRFKSKIIYWQMIFWAIFLELLCFKGFEWSKDFSLLVMQMYVLSTALYLFYYYMGRKNSLAMLLKQRLNNHLGINMSLVLIFLMFTAIAGSLTAMYNRGNRYYIWTYAVLYTLSLTSFLKQAAFTAKKKIMMNGHKIKFHGTIILYLGFLSAFLLQPLRLAALPVLGFALAFIVLCKVSPAASICQKNALCSKYENTDFIGNLYKYIFIKPLRLSGRFLWLLIDRLLVEKIMFEFSIMVAHKGLHWFKNIHRHKTMGGSIAALILLGLICFSFVYGGTR